MWVHITGIPPHLFPVTSPPHGTLTTATRAPFFSSIFSTAQKIRSASASKFTAVLPLVQRFFACVHHRIDHHCHDRQPYAAHVLCKHPSHYSSPNSRACMHQAYLQCINFLHTSCMHPIKKSSHQPSCDSFPGRNCSVTTQESTINPCYQPSKTHVQVRTPCLTSCPGIPPCFLLRVPEYISSETSSLPKVLLSMSTTQAHSTLSSLAAHPHAVLHTHHSIHKALLLLPTKYVPSCLVG